MWHIFKKTAEWEQIFIYSVTKKAFQHVAGWCLQELYEFDVFFHDFAISIDTWVFIIVSSIFLDVTQRRLKEQINFQKL